MNKLVGSIKILDSNFEREFDGDKVEGYIKFEYDPEIKSSADIMHPIIQEVSEGLKLLGDEKENEQKAFLCYLEAVRNVMRDAADKMDEIMDDNDFYASGDIKSPDELEELLKEIEADIQAQDDEINYMLAEFNDE